MSTQLDASISVPVVSGRAPHILIVRAPYYTEIVDGLRDGAVAMVEAGLMSHFPDTFVTTLARRYSKTGLSVRRGILSSLKAYQRHSPNSLRHLTPNVLKEPRSPRS